LGFIKRNVKTNSIKTKELAYKTYVRPKVEYCSVVWDPWQKQQINKIEMIQRRAARYTLNQYSYQSSVSAMLQHLCWPTFAVCFYITKYRYFSHGRQEITRRYSPFRSTRVTQPLVFCFWLVFFYIFFVGFFVWFLFISFLSFD
jgi:hypothetical protein